MGKETHFLLPCRRKREAMVPLTALFYLASADLFSSGRDELVARCKSEDCELEMHLTHLPDAVGYNAECCPVVIYSHDPGAFVFHTGHHF